MSKKREFDKEISKKRLDLDSYQQVIDSEALTINELMNSNEIDDDERNRKVKECKINLFKASISKSQLLFELQTLELLKNQSLTNNVTEKVSLNSEIQRRNQFSSELSKKLSNITYDLNKIYELFKGVYVLDKYYECYMQEVKKINNSINDNIDNIFLLIHLLYKSLDSQITSLKEAFLNEFENIGKIAKKNKLGYKSNDIFIYDENIEELYQYNLQLIDFLISIYDRDINQLKSETPDLYRAMNIEFENEKSRVKLDGEYKNDYYEYLELIRNDSVLDRLKEIIEEVINNIESSNGIKFGIKKLNTIDLDDQARFIFEKIIAIKLKIKDELSKDKYSKAIQKVDFQNKTEEIIKYLSVMYKKAKYDEKIYGDIDAFLKTLKDDYSESQLFFIISHAEKLANKQMELDEIKELKDKLESEINELKEKYLKTGFDLSQFEKIVEEGYIAVKTKYPNFENEISEEGINYIKEFIISRMNGMIHFKTNLNLKKVDLEEIKYENNIDDNKLQLAASVLYINNVILTSDIYSLSLNEELIVIDLAKKFGEICNESEENIARMMASLPWKNIDGVWHCNNNPSEFEVQMQLIANEKNRFVELLKSVYDDKKL